MSPETYAIAGFETEDDARKAGHTVPLTKSEADVLYAVNRKDRRAKLKELRSEQRRVAKRGRTRGRTR